MQAANDQTLGGRSAGVTTWPLLRAVVSARYPLLLAWAIATAMSIVALGDWATFAWAAARLFGQHGVAPPFLPQLDSATAPGGLHLFGNYPFLQMGPLSLLATAAISGVGPGEGQLVAVGEMALLGVGCVYLIERTALITFGGRIQADLRIKTGTLLIGVVALTAWAEVAGRYCHIDDALAVFGCVAALWGIASRKPALTGLALGLAIGSKAWAVGLAPLVLAHPGRDKWRAALWMAALTATAWLPFVIADPNTLKLGHFRLYVQEMSVPAVFGFQGPLTHGSVWRLIQFVGESSAVLVVVWKRQWAAALAAGFAMRLLLDPQSYSYYPASAVMGAAALDLLVFRLPIPAATLVAGVAWAAATRIAGQAHAIVDLTAYSALLLLALGSLRIAHRGGDDRDKSAPESAAEAPHEAT